MGKIKKKESITRILNPKNLQQQIDRYGYSFSMENYLLSLFVSLAGVLFCGSIFSLRWYVTLPVILVWLAVLPGMILNGYKNMYEHKCFLEAGDYIEQVLYSFQSEGKILAALRDTENLFQEGRMRTAIKKAEDYIERGVYETDLYQEALYNIEELYPGEELL